jgi:hypothetical protein
MFRNTQKMKELPQALVDDKIKSVSITGYARSIEPLNIDYEIIIKYKDTYAQKKWTLAFESLESTALTYETYLDDISRANVADWLNKKKDNLREPFVPASSFPCRIL